MSKYIEADRLNTEIERRIGICKRVTEDERNEEDMKRYYQGKVVALEEIRHLADSLQQEQPEVDFEKAYKSYMKSRKDDLSGNAVTINMKDIARHFYGLVLNARKEELHDGYVFQSANAASEDLTKYSRVFSVVVDLGKDDYLPTAGDNVEILIRKKQ